MRLEFLATFPASLAEKSQYFPENFAENFKRIVQIRRGYGGGILEPCPHAPSRAASALGVALATGEVDTVAPADIGQAFSKHSTVLAAPTHFTKCYKTT